MIESVHRWLGGWRYSFNDEKQLQVGISELLTKGDFVYRREAPLGEAGVVDFLLEGGLAIEVKVDGTWTGVVRQLHRYALRPEVRELLLVTSCNRHADMPETLAGKPVRVLVLGGQL
jgi:hypothetical protein